MQGDRDFLLAAARRLDQDDPAGAVSVLAGIADFAGCAGAAVPLWRASLRLIAPKAAAIPEVETFFDAVEALSRQAEYPDARPVFGLCCEAIDAGAPAALVVIATQVIGPLVDTLAPHERLSLFGLLQAAGQPGLMRTTWRRALRAGVDRPLDGWQLMFLLAAAREERPSAPVALLREDLEATGRADLLPLLGALEQSVTYAAPESIAAALDNVRTDAELRLALDHLVRAPATKERYLALAALVDDAILRLATPYEGPEAAMLALRRAVAAGRWQEAEEMAATLCERPETRLDAIGLRAAAQIGLGNFELGAANAGFLTRAPRLAAHDRGRGHALAWMARRRRDGVAGISADALPRCGPGRPLVQMLWVGPRLRWIETVALRSWLLNGWRVQLFVYDPPETPPEGVELMDASAVLPRRDLFREDAASGVHRGSLGAFSDRFRYALLTQRGGLWADTDMINLIRFEPEGARLVATEAANVEIETLNGALLAAPPGDPTLRALAGRAEAILADGPPAFARIGPQLLCEVMAEHGNEGFAILEKSVVNPFSWSETRRYFAPAEEVAADPRLAGAACLHVFTETWRLIGMDLDAPPPPETFLGRCAARIAAAPLPAPGGPADRVRRLLDIAPC